MSEKTREDGHTLAMLIGFWVAAAFNLAGGASGLDLFSVVTKPFLLLFLFFWAWQVLGRPKPRAGRFLLVGILFAWVGDVLLMLAGPDGNGPLYFLLGLAAFLVMQVCYIAAFWSVPGEHLLRRMTWLLIPFVAYWAAMTWLLDARGMRVAVLLYSLVLVGMAAAGLDLTARLPRSQAWPLFAGAVLFVVSDSLIALSAFGGVDLGRWQGFAVMATYIVAQFLIVTRFARGLNRVDESADAGEDSTASATGEPGATTAVSETAVPRGEGAGIPEQPGPRTGQSAELQDS